MSLTINEIKAAVEQAVSDFHNDDYVFTPISANRLYLTKVTDNSVTYTAELEYKINHYSKEHTHETMQIIAIQDGDNLAVHITPDIDSINKFPYHKFTATGIADKKFDVSRELRTIVHRALVYYHDYINSTPDLDVMYDNILSKYPTLKEKKGYGDVRRRDLLGILVKHWFYTDVATVSRFPDTEYVVLTTREYKFRLPFLSPRKHTLDDTHASAVTAISILDTFCRRASE